MKYQLLIFTCLARRLINRMLIRWRLKMISCLMIHVWGNTLVKAAAPVSPIECGWLKDSHNSAPTPTISRDLQQVVSCQCKTDCKAPYKCCTKRQPCMFLCRRQGSCSHTDVMRVLTLMPCASQMRIQFRLEGKVHLTTLCYDLIQLVFGWVNYNCPCSIMVSVVLFRLIMTKNVMTSNYQVSCFVCENK